MKNFSDAQALYCLSLRGLNRHIEGILEAEKRNFESRASATSRRQSPLYFAVCSLIDFSRLCASRATVVPGYFLMTAVSVACASPYFFISAWQ